MKNPKVSIVVPVYNCEKSLIRCLTSIKSQTFEDWECILINDGSTDHSGDVCEAFVVQDKRFKVIHKYNSGPGDCRNLGIYLSKGEWIGFVDSDDTIQPDRYSVAIEAAEKHNVEIVQCAVNVMKDGAPWRHWHLGEPGIYTPSDKKVLSEPLYDIGHCWDKIYRTSLLKDNNIKFADCDMCEDTILNIKAYCISGKILSIADKLYNYTFTPNSLSHSSLSSVRRIKIIKSLKILLEELKNNSNFNYLKDYTVKLFEDILNREDKIDYVFPYVDCTSPNWIKEYAKYKNIGFAENDNIRFQGHEELLKYKFRSIEKWMPWIGTIHMIVSSIDQVPSWVDTDTVHIVLHEDIIPKEYLPTFNSCTIEMFIHNIFGLSEKFIYSNDDMYANYILKPKFYFTEDNKLRSDLNIRKLWHEGDINKVWAQIPINTLKLAAKDKPEYLNKYVVPNTLYELQHIGKPMFKSINKQVYSLYEKEILQSITRFRAANNLNQYLFTEYALFHDRGSFETFRFKYLQIGRDTNTIIKSIEEPDENARTRAICCNDTDIAKEEDFIKIQKAFEKQYPKKSIYEV